MKETLHHVKASTQFKREHKSDYGHEKIEILYEDKDIVVINKPSGMLSVPYPGSKARTAIQVLEKIMRSKGTYSSNHKPLVVHRLDRDTSGVMMFALNESVQKKVMTTWHHMVSERLYVAVAENPRDPKKALPDSGLIDDELAQNSHHVGYVKHEADDKAKTVPARTHYKVLLRGKTHTMFELSLDTGKKNQIRAHLSSKHYPLAGDENYRANTDPFYRLALHARTLEFKHPVTGEHMKFEVPEDEAWKAYVEKGDLHPRKPIWKQPQKTESAPLVNNSRGPAPSVYGAAKNARLGGKKTKGMDFIAKGQARRGR